MQKRRLLNRRIGWDLTWFGCVCFANATAKKTQIVIQHVVCSQAFERPQQSAKGRAQPTCALQASFLRCLAGVGSYLRTALAEQVYDVATDDR